MHHYSNLYPALLSTGATLLNCDQAETAVSHAESVFDELKRRDGAASIGITVTRMLCTEAVKFTLTRDKTDPEFFKIDRIHAVEMDMPPSVLIQHSIKDDSGKLVDVEFDPANHSIRLKGDDQIWLDFDLVSPSDVLKTSEPDSEERVLALALAEILNGDLKCRIQGPYFSVKDGTCTATARLPAKGFQAEQSMFQFIVDKDVADETSSYGGLYLMNGLIPGVSATVRLSNDGNPEIHLQHEGKLLGVFGVYNGKPFLSHVTN